MMKGRSHIIIYSMGLDIMKTRCKGTDKIGLSVTTLQPVGLSCHALQITQNYLGLASPDIPPMNSIEDVIYHDVTHLLATTETQNQVQSGLLLNIVVRQGTTVLQLLTSKDETLLVRWDALLVLNLRLHIVDRIG